MTFYQISHSDWDIEIDLENGSLFRKCRFRDQPIFRDFDETGDNGFLPERSGHFPLLPFSNRIEKGRFKFGGREVTLPSFPMGQAHALHGFGWRNAWKPAESGPNECRLTQVHPAGHWPWQYEARQKITAEGNVLSLNLEVINQASSPMPCGVGFHPYFPDLDTALLQFSADGVWLPDENVLPVEHINITEPFDFSKPKPLSGADLDHCFTGAGPATISWTDKSLVLKIKSSDNLDRAAVYTATKDNCFCFEPVSHTHNALNMADPAGQGIKILQPGESLRARMEIEALI